MKRVGMIFAMIGILSSAMVLSAQAAEQTFDCKEAECSFNPAVSPNATMIFKAQCFQDDTSNPGKLTCSGTSNGLACHAEAQSYQCDCKNDSVSMQTASLTIICR